ncbi:LexA family protein [Streptomyces chryseus]
MTERQEKVLACIRHAIRTRGEAPTLQEIADEVGLSSRSSVHYQLRQLEQRGVVAHSDPRRWRSYRAA